MMRGLTYNDTNFLTLFQQIVTEVIVLKTSESFLNLNIILRIFWRSLLIHRVKFSWCHSIDKTVEISDCSSFYRNVLLNGYGIVKELETGHS